MTAPSRNSAAYQQLLTAAETANPDRAIVVITDNLSSHNGASTRTWLGEHPRIQQVFIPKGAAGSTCRRPGGGCFAAKPLPGSRCHPGGDHLGHQDGDLPAQCSCPAVGVGPAATVATPPTPRLHLPDLRNVAIARESSGWSITHD